MILVGDEDLVRCPHAPVAEVYVEQFAGGDTELRIVVEKLEEQGIQGQCLPTKPIL